MYSLPRSDARQVATSDNLHNEKKGADLNSAGRSVDRFKGNSEFPLGGVCAHRLVGRAFLITGKSSQ